MCLGPLCHALLHKSEREPASECSLCRMPEQQECSTLLWTLHKNVHPDSSAGYPASFCRLLEGRGRGERCSAFCCTFCFVLSDSSQQLWRNFGFCHCCLLQPAAGAGPRRAPCGGSECCFGFDAETITTSHDSFMFLSTCLLQEQGRGKRWSYSHRSQTGHRDERVILY